MKAVFPLISGLFYITTNFARWITLVLVCIVVCVKNTLNHVSDISYITVYHYHSA